MLAFSSNSLNPDSLRRR